MVLHERIINNEVDTTLFENAVSAIQKFTSSSSISKLAEALEIRCRYDETVSSMLNKTFTIINRVLANWSRNNNFQCKLYTRMKQLIIMELYSTSLTDVDEISEKINTLTKLINHSMIKFFNKSWRNTILIEYEQGSVLKWWVKLFAKPFDVSLLYQLRCMLVNKFNHFISEFSLRNQPHVKVMTYFNTNNFHYIQVSPEVTVAAFFFNINNKVINVGLVLEFNLSDHDHTRRDFLITLTSAVTADTFDSFNELIQHDLSEIENYHIIK